MSDADCSSNTYFNDLFSSSHFLHDAALLMVSKEEKQELSSTPVSVQEGREVALVS